MDDALGFSEAQKDYLDGFLRGIAARHGGAATAGGDVPPLDIHRAAQDRVLAAGRTLVPEEIAKRESHPFDLWDALAAEAAENRFPKGIDVFRRKFFGLFYAAPAENAFMCRLRIPNGALTAWQARGIADLALRHAAGSADITTRANLQLRGIAASQTIAVLTGLQDLGLTSRGSGADNIRNITGSPTAGIDPHELIDTRPFARALHHHILNHRELYGLPRKFNIAFDGGGCVGVLADTNDIGFAAVAVDDGVAVPGGIYFRLQLGGITGHGDFARDAGVIVPPDACIAVAVAAVRVFIANGDRTDRKRARLKYLLDDWGLEKFVAAVAAELGHPLPLLPLDQCRPRAPLAPHGHIGVHRQRQGGLSYIGVAVPVGRLAAAQLRGVGDIAERHGSGSLRLTVWQNLLLADIRDEEVAAACAAIEALGLGTAANAVRGGLVACTGNSGCKFAATDTKGQALALADHLDRRVALDRPVNIHLTGCPNSCAQHYVGDIGLLGLKTGDDMAEGYAIVVGGGAGAGVDAGAGRAPLLAREIHPGLPFAEVPEHVAALLAAYLTHRRDPDESFRDFAARHSVEALRALAAAEQRAA